MDGRYNGAMLQVVNPHGSILYRDARPARRVFYHIGAPMVSYSGTYQGQGTL